MNRKQRRAAAKQGRAILPSRATVSVAPEANLGRGSMAPSSRTPRGSGTGLPGILAVDPKAYPELQSLGLVAHQMVILTRLLDLIRRAIALNGTDPDLHNDIAGVYHSCGQ